MYELLCSVEIGNWIESWGFDVLRRYENLSFLVWHWYAAWRCPACHQVMVVCRP